MSRYYKGNTSLPVQQVSVPATSSGRVKNGRCVFYGIIVKTDGENDVTLNLYDSKVNGGTRLLPEDVVISGEDDLVSISYNPPLICGQGIYVRAACSGTYSYQVLWDD